MSGDSFEDFGLRLDRPPRHHHVWRATLYDGKWVEYCESRCGVPYRKARLRPNGVPVALPRWDGER